MSTIDVKVPDIGDFKDIPVIEVFVKPGDALKAEDSLVTLESDKATMDVPAPAAGVVKELKVKVGDKVSEGTLVLTLEQAAQAEPPAARDERARHRSRRARTCGRALAPALARKRAEARAARLPASPCGRGAGGERLQRPGRPRSVQGRARVAVGAQVRARARRRPVEA